MDIDVAIVGGGITGAFVAHCLTERGVAAVLIDRREICHGSTAASTGLLQYEIDQPLVRLARMIGENHAVRAYQACVGALAKMAAIVGRLDDDCGMTPKTSLYLASRDEDVQGLRDEYAARKSCGIELQYFSEPEVRERFSFSRPAALYSQSAMEIDPYRLAHALIRQSCRSGLQAFSRTRVTDYLPGDPWITLQTDTGCRIRARRLVLATGYEVPTFVDTSGISMRSTYALASEPLENFNGWHDRCLIWETARPYTYARTTRDGRAVIGGGDEPFADPRRRDALIADKSEMLERRFNDMFPDIRFTSDCAWAGTFAETRDGLPLVGTCRRSPNTHIALGYGGNGITFSLLAAEIIADAILGEVNPMAELFRMDR